MIPSAARQNDVDAAARATLVNRTHRVVRERARSLQAHRNQIRGLLLPMAICSALMLMLLTALWMSLDPEDLIAFELPDSAHHFLMMLVWFVPVSGALVAMLWFRRSRNQAEEGGQIL